ncbi:3-hydroxyisobutyryl-CoA hydrolase, mitochondrial [Ixodes scapularis]|uniref:3-hydroxyisobutyryl-CoA hydrolase, mitochondrial n=1 Tax=Ixodes scapularis TaxID=6945 RepID=UPI001161614B|nr:3-hydroxyisobutyryl-CoA hydrolase, mitochondrial [Ixodes scapularis]
MTFREMMRTTTFGLAKRFLRSQTKLHVHSMRAMSSETGDVIVEKVGNKGVIILDRPKALNALSLDMIRQIYPTLKKWDTDPDMKMVIIKAKKDSKAFCSGGDVKAIAETKGQDTNLRDAFFREEYRLNNLIASLTIPYVALLDGVTMGGGVGLSVHGTFRVATERTVFAMPETAIGFFPDVGGSYVLPRLPGKLGLFLGLTGYRLVGWDVLKGRIATHFSSSQRLENLEGDLMRLASPNISDIDKILLKHQDQCEADFRKEFGLKKFMGRINSAFNAPSVEAIIENLSKDTSEWGQEQAKVLQKMSPLSMKVTFRELQEGSTLTLQDALKMEFRLSQRFMQDSDFFEGVGAVLIERSGEPKWNPATLAEVTEEKVDSYFEPLPADKELRL